MVDLGRAGRDRGDSVADLTAIDHSTVVLEDTDVARVDSDGDRGLVLSHVVDQLIGVASVVDDTHTSDISGLWLASSAASGVQLVLVWVVLLKRRAEIHVIEPRDVVEATIAAVCSRVWPSACGLIVGVRAINKLLRREGFLIRFAS